MASFVTREELEAMLGTQRVLDYFDDDRDGVLNDTEIGNLEEVLAEANDFVVGQLQGKGYSGADELTKLSSDRALRRSAKQIAADLAGDRRPEFRTEDGSSAFATAGERGRAYLKSFATQEVRTRVETTTQGVGGPSNMRARVSSPTPNSVFGRDPSDPNDLNGANRGF